ncbi:hypothetical protein HA402_009137 [Bradysia odoriphaga]|nr:hypothetical protein HA402_009137 [Bradysia odoriphaga]
MTAVETTSDLQDDGHGDIHESSDKAILNRFKFNYQLMMRQQFTHVLRLNFNPVTDLSGRSADRVFTRSAAVLAALGIALSSFSLKQMVSTNNNSRRN